MLQLTKTYPKKRAFITGGASGLGRAFAIQLAQDGWTIAITDLNEKELAVTKNQIEALGGKAHTYTFDVADKVAYKDVAEDFLLKEEGIDVLINNAGVGDGGSFHEYKLEDWEWMMNINVMGVVYGCYHFVHAFRKQKSGHIINIASAAGFSNAPNMAPYNVSKAGVIALSDTLRYELKYYNVKISCVMPTFFKTNIMKSARGAAHNKAFGQKMIDNSKHEADEIAAEIFKKAGRGDFKIILPKMARNMYFLKKYFPKRFDNRVFKQVKYLIGKGRM